MRNASRARALLVSIIVGTVIWTLPVATLAETAPVPNTMGFTARVFRDAADRVAPSLVRIETFGGVTTREARQIASLATPGQGPTTGLIISSDGLILTSSFNFLRKPPIVTVTLADGSRHVAKLLGTDHTRKLTALRIDGRTDLPVPDFASRGQLEVGQWALSVGIGYGDDHAALSGGIISAVSRIGGKAVQTDANISPANYGGPLLDIDGRVIGICVPLSPGAVQAAAGVEWYDSGIGFAVPIEPDAAWLTAIKEGRDVERGHLGVTVTQAPPRDITPSDDGDDGDDEGKGEEAVSVAAFPALPDGVIIDKVNPGSPAAEAGLEAGDRILAVNDTPVRDVLEMRWIVTRYAAGDRITVSIERGDEKLEKTPTLTVAPAAETEEKPEVPTEASPEPE